MGGWVDGLVGRRGRYFWAGRYAFFFYKDPPILGLYLRVYIDYTLYMI